MSVSLSVIWASTSTARARPSMRPASSSKSWSCNVCSLAVSLAQLCLQKSRLHLGNKTICLVLCFHTTVGAFQ